MLKRTRADRRLGAVVLVALALLLSAAWLTARPAFADGPPVTCTDPNNPRCTVFVSDPGHGGSGPAVEPISTGRGTCTPPTGPGIPAGVDCNGCVWSPWHPAPGQLADEAAYEEWLAAGGKGSLYQQNCYPGPTTAVLYFPPGTAPPAAGLPPAVLGAQAVAMLPLPALTLNSAPGEQGRAFAMTFVNLPTFLWVDGAAWHPYSATASDGFKSVTAIAIPSSVTWSMGDGHTTACNGPGVAWHPGVEQSYCVYAYATSSVHRPQVGADVNDRPYDVSATVTYRVTWTCSGTCGTTTAGSVGAVDGPTSHMPLVVGELQTVVTG